MAAFAVGIPVIAAALLFVASQVKPGSVSLAGMFGNKAGIYSPVNYNTNLKEIEMNSVEPYVVDANGYANVKVFNDEKLTVVNISAIKSESKSETHSISHISFAGKFQVVLGCFGVTDNAKRMVRMLSKKHIKAGISGVNAKGMQVVSCGGFNDKESANALLQTVKSKCPSAWIMAQ